MATSKKKEVAFKGKPKVAVKNLSAPTVTKGPNNTLVVQAKWDYQKDSFSKKNAYRFEGVVIRFEIDSGNEEDTIGTISGNGTRNAAIKKVNVNYKKERSLFGQIKTNTWKTINRKGYYPYADSKDYDVQKLDKVKVYTLTKNPTWNKKTKTWNLPKNGVKVRWMGQAQAKKKKKWSELRKKSRTASDRPKKGTMFYKSLKGSEIKTRTERKRGKKKPMLDGIAVTVQGYNRKGDNVHWVYAEVKSITSKVNPKAKGYYEQPDKNKKIYKSTKDTKPKTGKKYYYRTDKLTATMEDKAKDSPPKQISYFNFQKPNNPSVTMKVGGQGTDHTLSMEFKSEIDKTNKKERLDTWYETYYSYGTRSPNNPDIYVSTSPTRIPKYSSTNTSSKFTVSINPNTYLTRTEKKKDKYGNPVYKQNKDGTYAKDSKGKLIRDTKTTYEYVTGLEEGEWLQFDVYYFNRGIAGTSVSNNTAANPSLKVLEKSNKKTFLYAWPYETKITSVTREGQHYRIKFTTVPTFNYEKRRTSKYVLQRLGNFRPEGEHVERWTKAQWNTAAAASENWKDVYSIGSHEFAFSDNVRDAAFEPSRRTYYRIKSQPLIEGLPNLYSDPKVIDGYTDVAKITKDVGKIFKLALQDNGRCVFVAAGFNRTAMEYLLVQDPPRNPKEDGLYEKANNGTGFKETKDTLALNGKEYYEKVDEENIVLNSNGSEISWSKYRNAWDSNDKPSTLDIYDSVTPPRVNTTELRKAQNAQGGAWGLPSKYAYFHTAYIYGLEMGTPYYFRFRRFLKDSDASQEDQYTKYVTYDYGGSETPIIPRPRPAKVMLTAPPTIQEGSSISLSWSYDDGGVVMDRVGTAPQDGYLVYAVPSSGFTNKSNGAITNSSKIDYRAMANAKPLTFKDSSGNEIDTTKNTSAHYCTIPYSYILQNKLAMKLADRKLVSVVYLTVRVKVGGQWSDVSNVVAVTIVKNPTMNCRLSIEDVDKRRIATDTNFNATLVTNDDKAVCAIRITNIDGCTTWMPYGKDVQPNGSVIYSERFVPKWVKKSDGLYEATWTSSGRDLDFRDGGKYRFESIAIHEYVASTLDLNASMTYYDQRYYDDMFTNYTSDGELNPLELRLWANGPMNAEYDTDQYTYDSAKYDAYGNRVGVTIDFEMDFKRKATPIPTWSGKTYDYTPEQCIFPPTVYEDRVQFDIPSSWPGCSSDDVIDLYRVTPDGAYLARSDILPGQTVIDRLPMYSNYMPCRYRIATRTSDGSVDWVEVLSGKQGHCVRFDWGDADSEQHGGYSFLELPYNLTWSDQWTKSTRIQDHMDGSYDAYWRGGVDRKNSFSTALLKFEDPEQIERVRALAKHTGPVYVRLPDGCAFCANVEVNSVKNTYNSLILEASFSAQEITMVPQYSQYSVDVI